MAIVTMTQALKKLYKAVVGEDTTKDNPTKIVSELADNWSGGGSGGTESLIVGVDHTEGTYPNVNTIYDKTWQEVKDALSSGKRVITLSDGMLGTTQQIILETGTEPFVVKGIKPGNPIADTVTLYACSEDGYLQTAECESSGGDEPGAQ